MELNCGDNLDTDISVNGLNNLLKSEQKSGEIAPLPKEFYLKINEKLKTFSTPDSDEYKNLFKLYTTIRERRTQKILVYLAYNKELPRPLPAEDEDLYIQIKNIINKSSGESKPSKLKVSSTIPQIVAPSGNKLGPYEQNEIVYVYDRADAKFMVENKLGETID